MLCDSSGAIKAPHSTQFDATAVKESLGLGLSPIGMSSKPRQPGTKGNARSF